jgi:hypothetical protein
VKSGAATVRRSRADVVVMLAALAGGLVMFAGSRDGALQGLGLSIAIGALADLAIIGPLALLARRFALDAARLRAALACPFCKDALPSDGAVACARAGCGAFYHPECWAECAQSYGGCAIYGCGCTTSRPVGRFALQRHVARLLLATLLFTPKLVKRIQEQDRATFREVWQRAREYQRGVSSDARTLTMGFVNLLLSMVVSLPAALFLSELRVRGGVASAAVGVALLLVIVVPPILFMRLPLAAHFGWGVAKVLARLFGDELAALRRADEGTFLARLAGGLGKK